ncbi:hypothetical protein F2Q69_00063795 [Brassica cretica]|uniref:RNase H type-1 domain-containing protein n=1 Tax=Brassica cretica TaxID=69181 RepID=A0A8S9RM54_BRACR|nr:hypothetical protein F2Q69_00063795 [Brassica cretica]
MDQISYIPKSTTLTTYTHSFMVGNIQDGRGGGGWVLRNERGVVILHSRRAFSGLFNKDEANFEILKWVVESMRSHRISNVIISGDLEAMFGAISRPDAWPSFLFYVGEIERELVGTSGIIFQKVSREENRGAMLIAQSVTRKGLTQSYVSRGHPNWFCNGARHHDPLYGIWSFRQFATALLCVVLGL